jgi:hypothetical protein
MHISSHIWFIYICPDKINLIAPLCVYECVIVCVCFFFVFFCQACPKVIIMATLPGLSHTDNGLYTKNY